MHKNATNWIMGRSEPSADVVPLELRLVNADYKLGFSFSVYCICNFELCLMETEYSLKLCCWSIYNFGYYIREAEDIPPPRLLSCNLLVALPQFC